MNFCFSQAKNRELLKQVAALSKGKKFDKSGSVLTSPWKGLLFSISAWRCIFEASCEALKFCVVEKYFYMPSKLVCFLFTFVIDTQHFLSCKHTDETSAGLEWLLNSLIPRTFSSNSIKGVECTCVHCIQCNRQ